MPEQNDTLQLKERYLDYLACEYEGQINASHICLFNQTYSACTVHVQQHWTNWMSVELIILLTNDKLKGV